MNAHLNHSDFSTILFMDSMLALQCKPLESLPWGELDSEGPILVMVVPQVNAEIDKRKRDGRLAKRARAFNRLITPAAESGQPEKIAEGPPEVFISIARCSRINWDELDDLDPMEGDHKVVAQILHTKDVPDERKLLLSQDTNPIFLASSHGLACRRLPDTWLLDPEPHPKDKEVTRLTQRVRELEANEPEIEFSCEFRVEQPIQVYKVNPLSIPQQNGLMTAVLNDNPKKRQDIYGLGIGLGFDHDYDDKYQKFTDQSVPRYVEDLHKSLEVHFAQVPFTLSLENVGHIQIEDFVLTLKATGGAIHDRFKLRGVFPPFAPQPKSYRFMPQIFSPKDFRQPIPDRHEVAFIDAPDGGDTIQFQCADFRHGRAWQFDGVAAIDPNERSPFEIEVELTATNVRGKKSGVFRLDFTVATGEVQDFVDLEKRAYLKKFPLFDQFEAALSHDTHGWFDSGDMGEDE